jgi:choline dehydrogenase-like flavoprotein
VIVDLSEQPKACRTRHAEVVIVGAGIAGLVLAQKLRRKDVRVLVLESGDRRQQGETHPLNHVVQLGDPYSGATTGRFRCLGGTSTRWGGALLPFAEHDFGARPYLDLPPIPIDFPAISSYLGDVETLFGLDRGSYEEEFVEEIHAREHIPTGDADFSARFAKWPTFKRRNIATVLRKLIETDPDLEIWINSTATSFEFNRENGMISSVVACAPNQGAVVATARHFVLCAGAIESTRLLLLLDRQYDERIFQGCFALGRYFYDHISVKMANIRAKKIDRLNRMAGFRFFGATMRSLRFELSGAAQERERVSSGFGHISFRTEKTTGFDTLRKMLRSLQATGRISPSMLLDVLRDVPYLSRLCFWRAFHKQLLWPAPAAYEFHVVAEQLPRSANFIALSSEPDAFGLPRSVIRWCVTPDDCRTFAIFRRLFDQYWTKHGLKAVGDLDWTYDPADSLPEGVTHGDVFHPGGSTRIGTDRKAAVVDSNLRSFDVRNLWVSSTSVFPSGGGANPTLTLMLLAMRLGDHLSAELKAQ